MEPYYSYQDVFLKPRYSPYHSRSNADTSISFGPRCFKIPVVPANMVCAIDTNLARWMSANDYFYIMHRFNVDHSHPVNQDNMAFVKLANEENWKTVSISIGVQEEDKEFLKLIAANKLRVDYITVDIAHAHSVRMKEMLEFIKTVEFKAMYYRCDVSTDKIFSAWSAGPVSYHPFIIAGNVATPEAVIDLETWGADSVKVGIAQGGACTTFGMTGFGIPMFTCIQECSQVAKKPVIADGGIRTDGDFAKALVAGGTVVMAGSVFAACEDSPAESVRRFDGDHYKHDEITHKIYYGSASEYNKRTKHHVEGTKLELACNGMTYAEKLQEVTEALQSSTSYAGGALSSAHWGVRFSR